MLRGQLFRVNPSVLTPNVAQQQSQFRKTVRLNGRPVEHIAEGLTDMISGQVESSLPGSDAR
jgi:hypothetical protein